MEEMSEKRRKSEREFEEEFDANKVAFFKALLGIPLLGELPENEEEIRRWEQENPEKARQLDETISRISEEFRIEVSPNTEDSQ